MINNHIRFGDEVTEKVGLVAMGLTIVGRVTKLPCLSPKSLPFQLIVGTGSASSVWTLFRSGDRRFIHHFEKSRDVYADELALGGSTLGIISMIGGGLAAASWAKWTVISGFFLDGLNLIHLSDLHSEDPSQVTKKQIAIQAGLTIFLGWPVSKGKSASSKLNTHEEKIPFIPPEEFKIGKEISSGKYSIVYEAIHIPTGEKRALKIPFDGLEVEMLHEIEIARRMAPLESPHLVKVVGYTSNERCNRILVMERVEGNTLASRIKQKRQLPVQESLDTVVQVSRGIEDLHKLGVIHRDIKPDNILVCQKTGRIKIADFGIAEAVNLQTSTISTRDDLGVCDYMAPEAFARLRSSDPKLRRFSYPSDIYSMGSTLFETLTGQRLLANRADESWSLPFDEKIRRPPPPLAEFVMTPKGSPQRASLLELDKVLKRALAYYPEDRFQTAQEFRGALLEWKGKFGHLRFESKKLSNPF